MICPNCNEEISDGHSFCGKCGEKLPDDNVTSGVKIFFASIIGIILANTLGDYILSKFSFQKEYYDYIVKAIYLYLLNMFISTYMFYVWQKKDISHKKIKVITNAFIVTLISVVSYIILPMTIKSLNYMLTDDKYITRSYVMKVFIITIIFIVLSEKIIDWITLKNKTKNEKGLND